MAVRWIRVLEFAVVIVLGGTVMLLATPVSFRSGRIGPIEIIRREFAQVEIIDVVIERSEKFGDVAHVIIEPDQIDAALIDNGAIPRRAAIKSGVSVEVTLADEWRGMHVKPPGTDADRPSQSN